MKVTSTTSTTLLLLASLTLSALQTVQGALNTTVWQIQPATTTTTVDSNQVAVSLEHGTGDTVGNLSTKFTFYYADGNTLNTTSPRDASQACPSTTSNAIEYDNSDITIASELLGDSKNISTLEFQINQNISSASNLHFVNNTFLLCIRFAMYNDPDGTVGSTYNATLVNFRDTAIFFDVDTETNTTAINSFDVSAGGADLEDDQSIELYTVTASLCDASGNELAEGQTFNNLGLNANSVATICLKVNEFPAGNLVNCDTLLFTDTSRALTQQILSGGEVISGMQSFVSENTENAGCRQDECISFDVLVMSIFAISTEAATTVELSGICNVAVGDGVRRLRIGSPDKKHNIQQNQYPRMLEFEDGKEVLPAPLVDSDLVFQAAPEVVDEPTVADIADVKKEDDKTTLKIVLCVLGGVALSIVVLSLYFGCTRRKRSAED